jgi:hypothetical protein
VEKQNALNSCHFSLKVESLVIADYLLGVVMAKLIMLVNLKTASAAKWDFSFMVVEKIVG